MADLATNNSQGGESIVPGSTELADASQQGGNTELDTGIDGEDTVEQPEPELDEVDYEGKKYKVPKEIKDAILRQSDYTRKTQEVSESKRSVEERQTALQNQERQFLEHQVEVARVVSLNDQLAQFEKVNWPALRQQDPGQAQDLWFAYQQARDARDRTLGELQQKVQQRSLDSQRETAKQIEQGHAAVARDVKDWTPETFGKERDWVVKEFGLKPEEVNGLSDPRLLKMLHRAYIGDQALKKEAAAQRAAVAENARPLTQLGSTASPTNRRTTDPSGDRLSADEWAKRERERVAKRR